MWGVMAFPLGKLIDLLNKAKSFPKIVESSGPPDEVGRARR